MVASRVLMIAFGASPPARGSAMSADLVLLRASHLGARAESAYPVAPIAPDAPAWDHLFVTSAICTMVLCKTTSPRVVHAATTAQRATRVVLVVATHEVVPEGMV
mmetsp:Transcript_46326/g.105026  ORF Transcript_46326/g.105026 Transcript_46326/m.105026 type:complete len:105 (-) Transcript_46326:408-722(-)